MSKELSALDLLPPEAGLTLLGCEKSELGWIVRAQGRSCSACPCCGVQSSSRHSRYWRRLDDLPVQGRPVTLYLRVSRWRCRNQECRQQIFTERLPNTLVPWGRRTDRVQEIMMIIGYRMGGRSAEFLMQRLALRASDDTVLRALKRNGQTLGAPVTRGGSR